MTCGTRSGYQMGCRCESCTAANRRYSRQYLRDRGAQPRAAVTVIGDWGNRAACKGRTEWEIPQRELEHPERRTSDTTLWAKRACFRCPVFEECHTWVMSQHEDPVAYHVCAGMTPKERRAERRRLALAARNRSQIA